MNKIIRRLFFTIVIMIKDYTVHTISSISVLMVIASSFSVRHICFYEWEPDHCAEDSRRRSYDVTSVSQMETSDDRSSRSVKLGACGLGSCLGVKLLPFPIHRIGRHELLLPLLNQQEVERVVVITDNRKLVLASCCLD